MDPISALSLACNVLQLVEQAIKAADLCKELYDQGSLDENNRIEEYADYLTAANASLEIELQKKAPTSAIRATKLQKICNDATKTAAVLKLELNKLKLSKKQGIRKLGSAFTISLRAMFKKGTIERLRQQLEAQETALQSSLVKELYIKAGQDNLTRRKEFRYLSKGQRTNIAKVLNRLQLASDDIIKAVETSETALSAHLDRQDLQLERLSVKQDLVLQDAAQERHSQSTLLQEHKLDALRMRLLDSLAFPQMNERRNMIAGRVTNFGNTYRWIFYPPPRTDNYQQHEFVNWLRHEEDIFWISGKPGSGKSSLMEYIYQSLQEGKVGSPHLAAWAGGSHVRLLSFWFFRPASTPLLKSLEGFWRSLCHQILDLDDSLPERIRTNKDSSVPASLKAYFTGSGSRTQGWTVTELHSWCLYLTTNSQYNYCILVDGLDEVTGEMREPLLDCVSVIASSSRRVKVCCSSRPEYPFQGAIRQYPSIRLQDFNYDDIKLHCNKRLDNTRAATHAWKICWRAEGVFLWAYLVTEDLRIAASQGDSLQDLELRLNECPTEMNKLFTFMLERQDRFYAKYPKPYLPLIYASQDSRQDPTVLELLLASQDETELNSDYLKSLDASQLASWDILATDLEANVLARCANLVERYVQNHENHFSFPASFPYQQLTRAHDTAVRFIHRSARDFLAESEGGVDFLQSCNISAQDAIRRLTFASIVAFLLNPQDQEYWRPLRYASSIHVDCWTSSETSALDMLFAEVQTREQWKWPSLGSEAHCKNSGSLNHYYERPLCRDISLLDNLRYQYALSSRNFAYIAAKLAGLGSGAASLIVGCCFVWGAFNNWIDSNSFVQEFIDWFERYLSWTRQLTLVHNLESGGCFRFSVTGCLWQHVQLAFTHDCFNQPYREETRTLASFIHGVWSREAQSSYVEGWLISATAVMGVPVIFLVPDDAASRAKDFYARDIFVIRLATQNPADWGLNALSFCSFSPAGLERFFEIGSTVNEALQEVVLAADKIKVRYNMRHAILNFGVCLAAILNQYLDELTTVEIARILFLHRKKSRLGFSKGEFCETVYNNNDAYYPLGRMSEEEGDLYWSEVVPEDDSELCNSIRRLLSKWTRKYPNPRWSKNMRLEESDSDEEPTHDAHDSDSGQQEVMFEEIESEDEQEEDHLPCELTAGEDSDHNATRDTAEVSDLGGSSGRKAGDRH